MNSLSIYKRLKKRGTGLFKKKKKQKTEDLKELMKAKKCRNVDFKVTIMGFFSSYSRVLKQAHVTGSYGFQLSSFC